MLPHATALSLTDLKTTIVRNPLTVSPDDVVIDAIAQMSGVESYCNVTKHCNVTETKSNSVHHFNLGAQASCVLVIDKGHVVGILTEQDIVRLTAQLQSLDQLVMRQVMTHPVVTLRESAFTDLFFAIHLLQHHHIRHLPILDDQDCLVGLITHQSLQHIFHSVDLLRLRSVKEVMTCDVVYALGNSSMLAIAQQMARHCVSSVIMVEPSKTDTPRQIPIGMLTARDLVQCQALGSNLECCTAASIMGAPVFSIKPDDSLWTAHHMMEEHIIRRLLVIGEQNELIGTVTQTHVLQALNPSEIYTLATSLEEKVKRLETENAVLLRTQTIERKQTVENLTDQVHARLTNEKLIFEIATQIRSSLSLQTILDTTVEQVRQMLGCDRVNIWRFEADWQTIVVAESTTSSRSLMGERVQDECLQDYTDIYRQRQIRVVPDIYTTDMANCHRELLIRLQTRAKILVPLLCGDDLWGLLNVAESQHSREWQPEDVAMLEFLSVQLAIALQQATTHQQLQAELNEHKQTEDRLIESERRYATLAATAPVGIFRTDAKGNCIYVNDRWCEITGLTLEAAKGEGWTDALHPEDRDKIADEWVQATQENRPFQIEYRFQRSDGSITWVYGQSVAERDMAGCVVGYLGTITDISDRKQTELALQQSEAQSRAILDAIPDLILLAGADGVYRQFSSPHRPFDLLPKTTDRTGHHMADIIPSEIAERHLHYLNQALATGEMQVYEHQIQVNGSLQAEEIRVVKSGEDSALFIIRDVSERKQAESEQLQAAKTQSELRMLEQILDNVLAGYWDWDIPNHREYLSPGFKRMFGYEDHELPNTPDSWQFIIFPDDLPSVFECFDRHVQSRGDIPYYNEVRYRHKDGSTVWVLCSGQVIEWDADGNPLRMIGCHVDISDRKHSEEKIQQYAAQLKASNQELEAFTYSVSHDLRAPLRHIGGFINALRNRIETTPAAEDAKTVHYLDVIEKSGQKMGALIEGLLTLSRVGRREITLHSVNLQDLIQQVIDDVRRNHFPSDVPEQSSNNEASPYACSIANSPEFIVYDLPTVKADKILLQQVFFNLIDNAVKFSRDRHPPRIEIGTLDHQPDKLTQTIYIRDNGVGFQMKYADKLFGAFQRLHSQTDFSGTGIGLAIVQRIIHRHGGSIWAESSPGNGACFYVNLRLLPRY
ncbi:MAG: PAS domain S-box protein [Cyanobacteria bacterium P01_A01_bin.37]